MENQKIVEQIIHGMDHYMEVLALPCPHEKYDDGMCAWIKPREAGGGRSGRRIQCLFRG